MTVIGQGSFGKVVQARYKATGDIYAMKVLEKKNIVERGEVEHTRTEKSILMKVDHPFLLRLHFSFQTADKLYLVMDFINGGELFYHIQNDHRFSNERACFYTAEICLAMSYLHTLGIVYRDLKPENILLDMKGHVKICDFGLSKEGLVTNERTKTFCGTPEYLAPEVLEGKYYNKSVDWWSVGTLIFEMLTGLPPFYSEDVQKMYNMKMTAELAFPDYIEDDAKDLIQKFLDRNPEKRLQDIEEIKKHPWFSEINWEQLYHKELTPPFVPDVTKESTELIDESFTGMDIRETIGESAAPQVKPDQFEGFTYVPKT
uniref:Protein kinase domain-containing protein n=1 Tax=Arcella intermedia TaxID=1963864 RepID=A0A6B2L9I5_9EUKA